MSRRGPCQIASYLLLGLLIAAPFVTASLASAGEPGTNPGNPWAYRYENSWVNLELGTDRFVIMLPQTDPTEILPVLESILDRTVFAEPTVDDILDYPGLVTVRFLPTYPIAERVTAMRGLASNAAVTWSSGRFRYRSGLMIPRPELLVALDPARAHEALEAIVAADLGFAPLSPLRAFSALDPTWLLSYAGSPLDTFALAEALLSIPGVKAAQPNFIRHLPSLATPNDTLFVTQWDLENTGQYGGPPGNDIRAVEAWDITTGSSNVTVAIIDEGVDTLHPDLVSHIVPGYDAVAAGGAGGVTVSGVPGSAAPGDAHGTACAGIVGADGNNALGTAGICWDVQIMPIRIGFGDFWTQDSWIFDGITTAIDMGADVLSNSWGGGGQSSFIDDAIAYARDLGRSGLGAVICFSSGNADIEGIVYPASNPDTIAVGASNRCDERKSSTSCDGEWWWGSQYGVGLDLVAPGPEVTTTDNSGSAGYALGDYVQFSGTSSACPHVAGAAALLLSIDPSRTAGEVRTLLTTSARDLVGTPGEDTPGWDPYMGWGRLDLLELLLASGAGTTPPGGLTCVPVATEIVLTWTNGDSYSSIEIFRDNLLIATLPGDTTTFTESNLPLGFYNFGVRGTGANGPSPRSACTVLVLGAATDLVWSPVSGAVPGGTPIADALLGLGRSPLLVTDLSDAGALDQYETIWVNLGIDPATYVLTAAEGDLLSAYLAGGIAGDPRALYMEGGDTWFFNAPTSVHAYFGIAGASDGDPNPGMNLGTVSGVASPGMNCDFQSMSFDYLGENQWIDRLNPIGTGVVILDNTFPPFHVAIANETVGYRTIGASWELAGVLSGVDSRQDFVEQALTCWGIPFLQNPLPDPVTTLTCQIFNGTSQLSWALGEVYDQIEVHRAGILVATLSGTMTDYVDPIPLPGANFYEVLGKKGGLLSTPNTCTIVHATPANELRIAHSMASIGNTVEFMVFADHALPIEGYTFAVTYDSSVLEVQELSLIGTELEATGADFFEPLIYNANGYFTVAAFVDSLPPVTESIPPGNDQIILRVIGELASGATIGDSTPLDIPESIGPPQVVTVFLQNGTVAYSPARTAGSLTVTANPALRLRADSQTAMAGSVATTTISLDSDRPLVGYSFGIPFDPTVIFPTSGELSGTVGEGAAISMVSIQPNEEAITVSVILDLIDPITQVIPIGEDQPALSIQWAIDPGVGVTTIPLPIVGGIGNPPVALVFTDVDGATLVPSTIAGELVTIDTVPQGTLFIRGDANSDGTVAINDPIMALSYLFNGGTIVCMDAADTNDDGDIDIGDSIYLLQYLFTSAAAPFAPFPDAGVDPTDDALDCG